MKFDAHTSICIVGAGASGLTAAYYLKRRGYQNVTVLEKLDRVGGKCESIEYPTASGRYVDLAATEMSQGYTNVMRLARELDVPTVGDQNLRIYDRANDRYISALAASKQLEGYSLLQSMRASMQYMFLLLTKYRRFSKAGNGFRGATADLSQPLSTWSRQHNLEALGLNFVYTMQVGYGRSDQVAAAYFIKFQNFLNWFSNNLSVLGISKAWPRYFQDGFQSLWNAVAKEVFVELDKDIVAIRRILDQDEIVIQVEIAGEEEPRLFEQLILCCPLDMDSVKFLDVTKQERKIFSRIRYVDYYTTACHVANVADGLVIPYPQPAVGDVTGFIKKSIDPDVAVFFNIATSDDSSSDVEEKVAEYVQNLPRWKGRPAKLLSVIKNQRWKFFPHVAPEDMAGGYFERFEALQGQRNTIYCSSILSFENVEGATGYARSKVFELFPDLTKRSYWYVVVEAIILFSVLAWSRWIWS